MLVNSNNADLMEQWERDRLAYGPNAFNLWEISKTLSTEPEHWQRCLDMETFEDIPASIFKARHKDRRSMNRAIDTTPLL